MKAVVLKDFGNYDRLELTHVKKPIPKAGQVLVKINYTGVNYIDTLLRKGDQSIPKEFLPSLPHILGIEGSGEIEKSTVFEFSAGQKVAILGMIGTGLYAEYVVVDANKLIPLHNDIDLAKAAAIPIVYLTAFILLKKRVAIAKGETVMIYASSGGVGTALIQLSKLFGLKVIALERKESKLQNSLAQGADISICTSHPDWKPKIKAFTGNKGVNHIYNSVAGDTLKDDLELIATHGNIVVYGMLGGTGEINLLAESLSNFPKSPSILFSELYSYFNDYEYITKALKTLFKLLKKGQINPSISVFSMDEVPKTHQLLENGNIIGKAVIKIN